MSHALHARAAVAVAVGSPKSQSMPRALLTDQEAARIWEVPWTFKEIPVKAFSIDPRFQRHITYAIVTQIIRSFKEAAFGVVYANKRKDGSLSVIDGQHRLEAARIAKGEDYLARTLLFEGLTVEQEASLFRQFNAARHRPSPLEIFKADLTAGEGEAEGVALVCDAFDVEINLQNMATRHRPRMLSAIGTARSIYRTAGDEGLREVFDIILEAWGDEPQALAGRNLKAVYRFVRRYAGEYDQERLIKALRASGMGPIERLGRVIGEEYGVMASTAMGRAIAANYNKAGKVPLPEWETAREAARKREPFTKALDEQDDDANE